MAMLDTHLDELLAVLRVSAGLRLDAYAPAGLRDRLAARLAADDPNLARRVRQLDDWQAESLADFVADAHALAGALESPGGAGDGSAETRVN
jgi:hypothetical protein